MKNSIGVALFILMLLSGTSVIAQQAYRESRILKVEPASRDTFQKRFEKVKWTGAGLDKQATIDQIPTQELRARLQSAFGDPTQKVNDLIGKKDFRPGNYVQFEYWFVVNDSIPMMVLDVDGPLTNGLVYAGDSRYVDLMPEIKRNFSKRLMEVLQLSAFADYYFDYDNGIWYDCRYENGSFSVKKIQKPASLKMPGEN